jgi:hypothetical protein
MKKLILSLVAIATITLSSFGQTPEGFKYQAVVRNASNAILTNQAVGLRMTIQQGAIGGTTVYSEKFATTTTANGLVNVEIGNGTPINGTFANINWANGPYFIETAVDVTGGTTYTVMGTSQLMSVPYALYAKTSGNGQGPVGPQGNQGPAGNNGATGPQGPSGNNGATGPQGPSGNNGATGSNGSNGSAGSNGLDGKNTLAKTTTESAGLNCTTGGVKLEYGLDANNDGTLDAGEINGSLTKYVCNGSSGSNGSAGSNGLDGKNTLAKTTTESVGSSNCATGGVKLEYGLDANNDGTLDVSEINGSLTKYVCNGATGTSGSNGSAGTNGNNGTNGQGGVTTAGSGINVTGAGTLASPYLVSTTNPCGLAIGQTYQGGIIFYLDASGCHGLISAPTDQSTGIYWYNGSYTVTNAVRDGVGAGKFNTECIIANQGVGNYAAQLCANYQGGNYGDWYLPSKYELNLLYLQKHVVGGFANDFYGLYWSSTEGDTNGAWVRSFFLGNQFLGDYYKYKDETYYVRAVRAF